MFTFIIGIVVGFMIQPYIKMWQGNCHAKHVQWNCLYENYNKIQLN